MWLGRLMASVAAQFSRPLNLMVLVLVLSFLVRVGAAATDLPPMLEAANQVGVAPDMVCEADPDIADLLAAIQQRQAALDDRETAINDRFRALEQAEAHIAQGLADLEAARANLDRLMSVASTAASEDVGQLMRVYEAMKPADAARLFEAMTADFAAGFLAGMQPAAAASIMAELGPDFAYAISVVIAGRHVDLDRP